MEEMGKENTKTGEIQKINIEHGMIKKSIYIISKNHRKRNGNMDTR